VDGREWSARIDAVELEIVASDRPGGYLLRIDGLDQSYVDLIDPTRLVFDYVQRIGEVVDAHTAPGQALRVLHIGGAGLTLPRYVAATRPGSAQIVLEPDVALTERVRAALPLPARSGIKVRPSAGRAGIEAVRDASQDLVVLDAFADGRLPADLGTGEFFAQVRRVLTADGLLAANLVDRAPFRHSRRVIAAIRAELGEALAIAEGATLRGRRQGNLVVVAGAAVPTEALRAAAVRAGSPYRILDPAAVSDTLGGGVPFTDADAQDGPEPSRPD
jgi:spermidine synthase